MMREESKASPVKNFGISAICLLLVLCLTSCSTSPPRILSALTPEAYKPYVELSDGYLHFAEEPGRSTAVDAHPEGEEGTLSYREALDILGFSLDNALAHLPKRLRFTKNHLDTSVFYLSESDGVYGGYKFEIKGEEYQEGISSKLVFRYQYRDNYMDHEDAALFRVVPWERIDPKGLEAHIANHIGIREYYYKSRVGSVEVGLLHSNYELEQYPTVRNEYYYAGFYIGDLAFALESHFGYCTQEEFIEVLLAIIDAAVASAE